MGSQLQDREREKHSETSLPALISPSCSFYSPYVVFQANPPLRRAFSLPGCSFISFGSKNTFASKAPPLYFTFFPFLHLLPSCTSHCCAYLFLLFTINMSIFTSLFHYYPKIQFFRGSGAAMCFIEKNFEVTGLILLNDADLFWSMCNDQSKCRTWIIEHKSASDGVLLSFPQSYYKTYFIYIFTKKISNKYLRISAAPV